MSNESSDIIIDEDGDTILVLESSRETIQPWLKPVARPYRYMMHDIDPESDLYAQNTISKSPTPDASNAVVRYQSLRTVCYQVSSTMLKSASQYFRNMFSGGFSEAFIAPAASIALARRASTLRRWSTYSMSCIFGLGNFHRRSVWSC